MDERRKQAKATVEVSFPDADSTLLPELHDIARCELERLLREDGVVA